MIHLRRSRPTPRARPRRRHPLREEFADGPGHCVEGVAGPRGAAARTGGRRGPGVRARRTVRSHHGESMTPEGLTRLVRRRAEAAGWTAMGRPVLACGVHLHRCRPRHPARVHRPAVPTRDTGHPRPLHPPGGSFPAEPSRKARAVTQSPDERRSARGRLLTAVVAPDRLASATTDRARSRTSVADCACRPRSTHCSYLTWLREQGATARDIRRRLSRLDLNARLEGRQAYTADREVRRYLLGLHREANIGATVERCDPLYRELVEVLVTAVMRPTPDQLRDRAAILVAAHSGVPARPLARITWQDVRWTAEGARITVPPPSNSTRRSRTFDLSSLHNAQCPIRALRRLRQNTGIAGGYVFGTNGGLGDGHRIRRATRLLEQHQDDLAGALRAVSMSARQLRARALLVLGYGTAIRTTEATRLRVRDLEVTPDGVLVRIAGRRLETGLRTDPGMPCDPVTAWTEWLGYPGRSEAIGWSAFPQINGSCITGRALSDYGVNAVLEPRSTEQGSTAGMDSPVCASDTSARPCDRISSHTRWPRTPTSEAWRASPATDVART